jgi:hypothetical protein
MRQLFSRATENPDCLDQHFAYLLFSAANAPNTRPDFLLNASWPGGHVGAAHRPAFRNSMLNRLHPARAMSDTLSEQSSYVLPVAKITEILAQNDTRPNVKEGGRRPQISAAAGSYSAVFRGCKPDEARSRPAP